MIIHCSIANFSECIFSRSEVITEGGAFAIYRSTVSDQYSNFTNNHAVRTGGVLLAWLSTVTVERSTFEDNSVTYDGGVMAIYQIGVRIHATSFRNSMVCNGGAIRFDDNSGILLNDINISYQQYSNISWRSSIHQKQ